jgi:sugar lactone lactonase YvrE
VTIENRPSHLANLHLHAIDAWIDPKDSEKLTFFINNHGVPAEGDPHKVGADSTVEIFETRLGSKTWRHVQTVRHPLVLTPNNIVSTGPRSFYISNDHFHKTSFKRILPLYRLPGSAGAASSVVHCDASSGAPVCIEAATGIQYPNGIAKGPEASIYVASTALGEIKQFHMQADKTLIEGDLVADVKRAIDNIQVDEKGGIIVATIPKAIDFIKRAKTGEGLSAVEVWRVRNETSDQK